MRCRYLIHVWTHEEVFWIERENGKTIFLRINRPVKVKQQCQVTTRQKLAKCWKDHQMCGEHAALMFPEQYPKTKGHATGGRHGLSKNNSSISLLETPLIEN